MLKYTHTHRQDDMEMTEEGWNVMLSAPARAFDDVVGVSARCVY
jgi:hypothetical protein